MTRIAGALAGAVGQDLLVRQHRLATGAPVDRGVGPVGEAGLEHPQEDGLVPPDVLGVVAPHLAPPVVDGPEAHQGLLELADPGVGKDPGVRPGLDGGVFGRKAEGVEAQGRENGLTLHRLVADDEVAKGVVAHVALMGRPRRVRVHAEDVEGRPGVVVVDLVGPLVQPPLLPLPLDGVEFVRPRHCGQMLSAAPGAPGRRRRPDRALLPRGMGQPWVSGREEGTHERQDQGELPGHRYRAGRSRHRRARSGPPKLGFLQLTKLTLLQGAFARCSWS